MNGTLADRRNSIAKLGKRSMYESIGDDLELGCIEVTRDIEVISAYKEPAMSQPHLRRRRDATSPHLMSFSSERPLQEDQNPKTATSNFLFGL